MNPFPLGVSKNNNKRFNFWHILGVFYLALWANASASTESAVRTHGIALYGEPKYAKDFSHFDFVNPNAPKGGHITLSGHGTFDNLNPYILKGTSPANTPGFMEYGIHELNETLLAGTGNYAPSGDEPSTAYGLIAKTLEYPSDYSQVTFYLNPKAHFHDGSAITSTDVAFSFEILKTKGHPRYQSIYSEVENFTLIDSHTIRFNFKTTGNKSLILRVGELPVLSKRYWEKREFNKALTEPPLLSGPYKIKKVDFGRSITYERVDNFWAKDHPIYKGRFNFDSVTFDFYRDITVSLEAFKSHDFDAHMEYVSKQWVSSYDIPAVKEGKLHKAEIPHSIAQGTQAFFFNTRKPIFEDKRVREAISLLFDFEWTNKTIFSGAYQRSNTFYPNSSNANSGLPSEDEKSLLNPFREQIDPRLFDQAFTLPVNKGDGNIRTQLRSALALLKQAGWELKAGKLENTKTGKPFKFQLLKRFDPSFDRILLPFKKNLEKAGISLEIRSVDHSQYKAMIDEFDFDMIVYVLPQPNSPSLEQKEYFHSDMANTPGSRNFAGISNPVVDTLVEHLINANDTRSHQAATRALDRVLLWEHYTIPHWYIGYHRFAYWDELAHPKQHPPYSLGFTSWWIKGGQDKQPTLAEQKP